MTQVVVGAKFGSCAQLVLMLEFSSLYTDAPKDCGGHMDQRVRMAVARSWLDPFTPLYSYDL
jgi:hypothetical protein